VFRLVRWLIVVGYSRWIVRREVRIIEQGLPLTWGDHPTSSHNRFW